MTEIGQKRRFDRLPFTSGLLPSTDIVGVPQHVANVPNSDIANASFDHFVCALLG
jgi:hypothetical protein